MDHNDVSPRKQWLLLRNYEADCSFVMYPMAGCKTSAAREIDVRLAERRRRKSGESETIFDLLMERKR